MDPAMRSEHRALLELMPGKNVATHTAAADGPWFSGSTWANGKVPERGAIVHIPESVAVTYEGESPSHLFMLRVDGTLRLSAARGVRTGMVVDTLYTTPAGSLFVEAENPDDGTIDIELRPFDIEAFEAQGAPSWGRAAKALYSDGAPVTDTGAGTRRPEDSEQVEDGPGVLGRYGWDPEQLSLGLITHGSARIAGKPKRAKSAIARTARKGDTSVRLSAEPTGWGPGDLLAITGVHYVGRDLISGAHAGSQDEIRTIVEVAGREIRFERPLEFDHDPPREDLRAYAANLTRNVLVHSSEGLPLEHQDAADADRVASRLGHVMFMHDERVSVRYAAFDDLGRTNKTQPADDIGRHSFDGLDAPRRMDGRGAAQKLARTPADQLTNPRGRYAVHVHRAGATADDDTALIEGSVVTGGPGWGFVSHDSRADFLDNVAYGVLGASFVAETGNETGTWKGNIAINTYGADFNSPALEPKGLARYENDDFYWTVILEKWGSWKNHDFGHFGDGFWFQGKLIDVIDNVSANSGLEGYFFMFRAPDQIKVTPQLLKEPLSVHSPAGIHPVAPGLNVFTGNQSIADRGGLVMIGIGGGRTNDERSVIADFTAWEVGQVGTHSEYYPGYTVKDSTFIASTSPAASPTEGVLFNKVMVDDVLANLTIVGFPRMYVVRKSWSPGARNQQGFADPYEVIAEARAKGEQSPLPLGYAHVLIDPGFTREEASEERYMGPSFREEDLILTSDQLDIGRLEIELDDDSLKIDLDHARMAYGTLPDDPVRPTLQEGAVLLLRGIKRDSIGEIPIAYHNNVLVWHEDAVQHRLESEGYYHMPNGRLGVILEELFSDRYTAEKKVVRFVAQLDPRWKLGRAVDRGEFDRAEHASVYVPAFLLGE
jgi:hypothetical protein